MKLSSRSSRKTNQLQRKLIKKWMFGQDLSKITKKMVFKSGKDFA